MAQHASGETRTLRQRFFDWCAEDSAAARFERSVAQGVIGVAAGIVTAYATQLSWPSWHHSKRRSVTVER